MATNNDMPFCDAKLSKTQVRNPKLPVPDSDSWIESVPWATGEAFGVSTFAAMCVAGIIALPLGVADIFLPVNHAAYITLAGVFFGMFMFAMWCVKIAPSRHRPIELGSVERRQAWIDHHALPVGLQGEVSAAFDHYMNADRNQPSYFKAQKLWNQTYAALLERERLLAPQQAEETDHRLEQAKQDLEVLEGTIKQIKENNK